HDVCRRGERRQTLRAGIAYDTDTPLGYHTLRRVETHHLVGVLSRGERQTQLANTFRLLSPGLQAGRAVADTRARNADCSRRVRVVHDDARSRTGYQVRVRNPVTEIGRRRFWLHVWRRSSYLLRDVRRRWRCHVNDDAAKLEAERLARAELALIHLHAAELDIDAQHRASTTQGDGRVSVQHQRTKLRVDSDRRSAALHVDCAHFDVDLDRCVGFASMKTHERVFFQL